MGRKQPGLMDYIWVGAARERLVHRAVEEQGYENEHALVRQAVDNELRKNYPEEVRALERADSERKRRREEARRQRNE